jgi:hypothetical protein
MVCSPRRVSSCVGCVHIFSSRARGHQQPARQTNAGASAGPSSGPPTPLLCLSPTSPWSAVLILASSPQHDCEQVSEPGAGPRRRRGLDSLLLGGGCIISAAHPHTRPKRPPPSNAALEYLYLYLVSICVCACADGVCDPPVAHSIELEPRILGRWVFLAYGSASMEAGRPAIAPHLRASDPGRPPPDVSFRFRPRFFRVLSSVLQREKGGRGPRWAGYAYCADDESVAHAYVLCASE